MSQKHRGFILILLFFTFVFCYKSELNAQETPSIRLRLSPQLQQGLQVVYMSDLDLLDQGVANLVFYLELWNVNLDIEDTRLILRITQDEVPISRIESDPFTLLAPDPLPPPGSPSYIATNVDLLNTGMIPNSSIHLVFHKTVSPPDDNFEEYMAQSGKFERGIYYLEAILENREWGHEEVKAELRLNVTNPSTIFLQSPSNLESIRTEFPLFQFESDASEFIVYVYKKLNPDDDVETVLTGHPTLEYATNLKQFSYNITDGDPLESGATYLWYVKVLVYTTSGLEEFSSNVYQFTVDTEGGSFSKMNITLLLEPLLGNRAETIAKDLSNYDLTSIKLNGKTISLQEFYQILNSYEAGRFDIKDLELQ